MTVLSGREIEHEIFMVIEYEIFREIEYEIFMVAEWLYATLLKNP